MKKIINLKKIHTNKDYENQLFELNINSIFYEDIIRNSTICMLADIEEQYVNVPVMYNDALYILKQRIYVDTRTCTMYDHMEKLDEKYAYFINMRIYNGIPDNIIRHLEEFKPLGEESFFTYEDYENLIRIIEDCE